MAIRYYLQFVTVPAIAAFCAANSALTNATITAFIVGYLGWVFIEYGMHRVLFHNTKTFKAKHFLHHREPLNADGDPDNLTIHCIIALVVMATVLALGPYLGWPAAFGLVVGYLSYITTHHLIHIEWLKPTSVIRKRHELHHKGWAFNYNLLCPLGDLVFGTYKEPR